MGKTESTWLQKPEIVSKGAEFCLAHFAKNITDKLEADNLAITETYYKEAICKIIMFKEVEKLVSKSSWYGGGYRANIVTYTISYLSYIIEKQKKFLNFNTIWDIQELPQRLHEILETIAEKVHDELTNPPAGHANVSQWAKKEQCWDYMKNLNINVGIDSFLLTGKEENKYNKIEAKKTKKLDSEIEIQSFIIKLEEEKQQKLLDYYQNNDNDLSPMQMDILSKYVSGTLTLPSAKQSKIIYSLYLEATELGVVL